MQSLELSTFFGAFSLTTWCGIAAIDEVLLSVKSMGICTLKVYEYNGLEPRRLLLEQRLIGTGEFENFSFNRLLGSQGILFPAFEVYRGDEFELLDVAYLTTAPPSHSPRLAIVMPTFRREEYAKRNIDRIVEGVHDLAAGAVRLFVVDNAGTLELPAIAGVELIRNRNFGGSGGFARGTLEARKSATSFTHVLYCDDDVLFDSESIRRLLKLIGYVRQDAIVSGGMLKMGNRSILHEKDANVTGLRFSSNRGNRDLSDIVSVARYDETGFSTFSGWWFVCYPIAHSRDSFLPYPFFVGWDDVEMGRRCNRLGVAKISLIGIAIWHDEFEKKDSNWRWFYHARNGMVTNLLYGAGKGVLRAMMTEIMTALLTYRYERAEFMIDGLAAVLGGPASIRARPADELHDELLSRQKNGLRKLGDLVQPERVLRRHKPSMLGKYAARISMNGHLLPIAFFKSANDPADAGWAVEPLHSTRLVTIFRCPRVVYYEPISAKGMLCDVDHPRFYRLLYRMLVNWMKLRFRWASLTASWQAEHESMTSRDFWTSYLDQGER